MNVIMKCIKVYNMELYSLNRDCFISQLHKLPQGIEFHRITESDLEANKSYCASHYKSWKYNLKKGAEGLFATYDNEIVAHGWLKKRSSKDPFYLMEKNVAYLSEFYVNANFRGRGIYPAMLSQFISNDQNFDSFFISIYQNNVASRNGLLKVGFKLSSCFRFVRAFKITLNKHRIRKNG